MVKNVKNSKNPPPLVDDNGDKVFHDLLFWLWFRFFSIFKVILERVTGVEPVSSPWQGDIMATIRYPQIFQSGGPGGNRTHMPLGHNILSVACIPVPPLDLMLDRDDCFPIDNVEMMGVEPMSSRRLQMPVQN